MKKHTCHWPTCNTEVPPKLWGCLKHWKKLPYVLRALIWKHYRPGQEITKTPSRAYARAAHRVHLWCLEEIRSGRAS